MVTVILSSTTRDDENDDDDVNGDDEGNDCDDDDDATRDNRDSDGDDVNDDDDCDITKMNELTCNTGVDNKVKNSADAILPIRMFDVVCICFAVKITSTVSKLPVTRTSGKI